MAVELAGRNPPAGDTMAAAGDGTRSKTACVTGGNGYIASALVKMLLEKGYAVKTTVRNPGQIDHTHRFSDTGCSFRHREVNLWRSISCSCHENSQKFCWPLKLKLIGVII
jgi:hypothetical protein